MARRPLLPRLATLVVCTVAGGMIAASALASRGFDLRPDRNADLTTLVDNARARHDALQARAGELQARVDELSRAAQPSLPQVPPEVELAAGMVPVSGPGVVVVLTDAPLHVAPKGIDEDLLVVHQQDIQAVLNALWAAGAEATTVQGMRVGPTTGIKCVGNTVILDGVPYAPPYVVAGIGDPVALERSLADSAYLKAYRKVVDLYGLGWSQERRDAIDMPAWASPAQLRWARPK